MRMESAELLRDARDGLRSSFFVSVRMDMAVRGRNRSRRPGFLPDERNGTIGM
ncbi:hypothetical protein [Eubacterium pyruvativorans]|uniref:hypothetical protein n=1 Tax=Eubacterium pyruvativorans TaxID=155865 RepID=UPI0023F05ADA|nr:hypothetical protein [Eubacterium pyruvativorans]MCI5747537.1 hypothetical protein [Eubacterium pyruvativorans]MDY4049046.1 hypothetical protein [Eubacterium pyruvativorans]